MLNPVRGLLVARQGLVAVLAAAATAHWGLSHYVAAFYRQNLPHYDSIGSYTVMFEVMNHYRAEGFTVGLASALAYFMSWLQGFFALFGASFLSNRPESVQLLNSLALLAFMVCVYRAAKSYGAGELKAYLLSLMVFLPDVFYDWWGGMADMRRDFSFVALLGAEFFAVMTFIRSPGKINALVVGVLGALTVYSRDGAIFFLGLILGPVLLLWLIRGGKDPIGRRLASLLPGLGIFMILTGPWLYLNLAQVLSRRLNPFVIYGAGAGFLDSFAVHWTKPFAIMFGRLARPLAGTEWTPLAGWSQWLGLRPMLALIGKQESVQPTGLITMGALLLIAGTIWLLSRRGVVRFSPRDFRILGGGTVVAGFWALVVTYLVICGVVGLRALDYSSSQIPFFPSLLFFFALFFAAGLAVSARVPLAKGRRLAIGLLATLVVAWLAVVRMEAMAPVPTSRYVSLAHRLAEVLAPNDEAVRVAYMWHDTISYDTLRFYDAQRGVPSKLIKFTYEFGGNQLDFAVARPAGVDPDEMLRALGDQLDRDADFVVLSTDPRAYAKPGDQLFLFEFGQPLIDQLLVSTKYRRVFEFDMWGQPFAVLRRQNAETRATAVSGSDDGIARNSK